MDSYETLKHGQESGDNQAMIQTPIEGDDMSEALVIREESAALMPVMSIETATERYRTIVKYVQELMRDGTDFGKIPGTDKNTLLKPGAEKLCTLFGLSKHFALVEHVEDWRGDQMGEPFFNYLYRCGLYRGDALIAESDGSCNSRETKYRWRDAKQVCPQCNQPTIFRSKRPGEGFYCWAKKGGCAATFEEDDERITKQTVGRIPNPDVADQVNTIQKMAQKRALIAATLLAVNASEFFTQDLDDFVDLHPETDKKEKPVEKQVARQTQPRKNQVNQARKVLIQSVADAFKLLNAAGDVPQWTPKSANDYVALNFQGVASVDDLDDGQVSDLLRMLSERVDSLKNGDERKNNLIASIKTWFDSELHLNNYLSDHGGKPIDQYTIPELEAIETDCKIPF